jgi:hypothetical protein
VLNGALFPEGFYAEGVKGLYHARALPLSYEGIMGGYWA